MKLMISSKKLVWQNLFSIPLCWLEKNMLPLNSSMLVSSISLFTTEPRINICLTELIPPGIFHLSQFKCWHFFAILFSLVEFPSNSKNSLNLTVTGHTAPLLLILKQLTASYWKISLASDGPERMPLWLKDRNMPSFFKNIRAEIGIYEYFLTEGLILLGSNGVHDFWICFLVFLLFLLERPFLAFLSLSPREEWLY